MDLEKEITEIIDNQKPESSTLEYKAVLPPSKSVAKLISSFANSEGGYIILGILDNFEVIGLSQDFHANTITHKALDLLTPKPIIHYQYVSYQDKSLYVIKVEKSHQIVHLEDKVYHRINASSVVYEPIHTLFKTNGYQRIKDINEQLESAKSGATNSKNKLIEHYQSILKIIDDLEMVLYPVKPEEPTTNQEGKVLTRILYSSVVDNFETYLSELLYEIFLANPSTLKSKQEVTVEEVLNCSDLQDFVKYWAKQKIGKLQKGSVKGFIKDNKQIRDLDVIDENTQKEIELLLQIRHLYSHRNGIVDEKFLRYNGDYALNSEHQMSISEICDKLYYFSGVINKIDEKAILKYNLSTDE